MNPPDHCVTIRQPCFRLHPVCYTGTSRLNVYTDKVVNHFERTYHLCAAVANLAVE